MFTGIVEEVGTVRALARDGDSVTLSVASKVAREGLGLGDSVCVDGACLTIIRLDPQGFVVGLAPETLRRTALGQVRAGSRVNLERALRLADRLGGHIVQGHVDDVVTIVSTRAEGDSLIVTFQLPHDLGKYVVEKGFVALDGTSLTVSARRDDQFSVALIAYTRQHVALVDKQVGDPVNLETDMIAKYVESILSAGFGPRLGSPDRTTARVVGS